MNKDEMVRRGQAVEFMMSEEGFKYLDDEFKKEIANLRNSLIYGDFFSLEERTAQQLTLKFIESLYRKLDKWVEEKNKIVSEKLEDNSDLKPRR